MNIINTVKAGKRGWGGTPLQDLVQHIDVGARKHNPCYSFDVGQAQPKDLKKVVNYFTCAGEVNAQYLFNVAVSDYDWFNRFIQKWHLSLDASCFGNNAIRIAALHDVNPQQLYALYVENHLYLVFFDCNKTQIITARIHAAAINSWDEYADIDDRTVGVYKTVRYEGGYRFDIEQRTFRYSPKYMERTPYRTIREGDKAIRLLHPYNTIHYRDQGLRTPSKRLVVINDKYYFLSPIGENGPGYAMLEDELFFANLHKICCIKNITDLHKLSEPDFWDVCYALCLVKQVSPNSGLMRVLKYKLIIINKLMGFDRFDERTFKLKNIHFNKIKNDYYFTRNLSLADVLKFDCITEMERSYLHKIVT